MVEALEPVKPAREPASVQNPVCVCVFSFHSFWTSMDVPAGVTQQEEGNTGFSIHLLSAVLALFFFFFFSREKDSAIPFPRRP